MPMEVDTATKMQEFDYWNFVYFFQHLQML